VILVYVLLAGGILLMAGAVALESATLLVIGIIVACAAGWKYSYMWDDDGW
jgi:hypothetical protein